MTPTLKLPEKTISQLNKKACSSPSMKSTPRSNLNSVLYDIRAIGYMIYTLIAGESPWQGRISKKIVEGASIGYVSFTNPLWKKVSQEAFRFVKRLIKPMQATETYELLLNDPFITKYQQIGVNKVDLFADNIFKIKKVFLL